ncbi:oxygen-insensitive NADPH nitroreductase [Vibrio sp. SS-MA-C1-2]|uniref:oxygen-insensitive NADPH nitroreductase n=1 Tax=Vibrio sp. SS-MA-C1-2 TaxID=2908646 RepID=UPI001F3615E9|nr:oxygen-insensitive NADPH nitroreductase [Vibrio sp. SS-MA-C1-2]UJF17421.1 oxygen-insensitive NADPH nitroreductase [Vibrio sp. SS-MA-C1-2]
MKQSQQTIATILNHRSIRRFTDQPIDKETFETLIDCAIAASSSSFLQCLSIIRITKPESRKQLAEFAGGQPYVESAAEFVVFCIDFNRHREIYPQAQLGFTEQTLIGAVDAGATAQNFLLAAESLGLGGVYIGGLRNNPDKVDKLLALPQHVAPLFGLCLGHPDQNPEKKPRLPRDLVLHQEQYQPLDRELLANYDNQIENYYQNRSSNMKTSSWSSQITATLEKEARPFMRSYLQSKGLSLK